MSLEPTSFKLTAHEHADCPLFGPWRSSAYLRSTCILQGIKKEEPGTAVELLSKYYGMFTMRSLADYE